MRCVCRCPGATRRLSPTIRFLATQNFQFRFHINTANFHKLHYRYPRPRVFASKFTVLSHPSFTNCGPSSYWRGAAMSLASFVDRLRRSLCNFGSAKGGNVILTFAFATLPIIAFVGAAVDYSRGNSAKAAMQAAVDATALMLSKTVATDTQSQLN